MRLRILISLSLLALATPAGAQNPGRAFFRVSSEIAGAEIVLQGTNARVSSPAPLVVEGLDPGRYRLFLYRDGVRLGETTLEARGNLRLTERRASRAMLSAIIPGMGQWRDLGIAEGAAQMGSVASALGRSLFFSARASKERELLEALEISASPAVQASLAFALESEDREGRVWLEEQTRNDYAILAGYLHLGNVAHAGLRRGLYRFELSGTSSVAARYRTPTRASVGTLSLLWPGLGQTRMGAEKRGRIWSLAGTGALIGLVEAQRYVDQRLTSQKQLQRLLDAEIDLSVDGQPTERTRRRLATAGADLESARSRRSATILGVAAFWALNVADALFLASPPPVPSTSGGFSALPVDIELGLVDGAPGLVLSSRF